MVNLLLLFLLVSIPIPQLTMPAWIQGDPGDDWTSNGPPLSPYKVMREAQIITLGQRVKQRTVHASFLFYLTRIFARSRGANHVVEDFVFPCIKRLAFCVSHQLNGHLLQDGRLKSP